MKPEVSLVNGYCAVLGEGPFWDAGLQKLWWIDGLAEFGRGDDLHLLDPKTGEDRRWHIGKHLGCALPLGDGRVMLALQDGIALFQPETQALTYISGLEREIENNRLNDGKCDSRGRLWLGSMSMTANQPGREFEITGSFYRYAGGKAEKQFGGVGISNGMAWNAGETTMYYVDSTPQTVYAFDFDAETGVISNRRAMIHIDPAEGCPDGMCIDAEGMLWIALFGGWKVVRYDPATGTRLSEIPLPCAQVTCCTFGGENLDELYITTASIGLSEEERRQQPLAGAMFMVRPGVAGTLPNRPIWKDGAE